MMVQEGLFSADDIIVRIMGYVPYHIISFGYIQKIYPKYPGKSKKQGYFNLKKSIYPNAIF